MSNFQSATGLLGTVVVAGTALIGLKLATDFIGGAMNNAQNSIPKSSNKSPKPFHKYPKMNYNYGNYNYGFSSKKSKKQDIFTIKF